MIAAASTLSSLGAELATNASAYDSVISQLGSEWQGPSSAAMATAAQPYIEWLDTTSAQLQQAAIQATSSAAAYEAAFSAVIPPPVIAANRAQLAVLVATNVLGQNTPAIAVNEAMYAEFWAQDAAAMFGYAGASAAAAQLSPLTPPAENTNPGGAEAQGAAVSSAVNSDATSSGLNGLLGNLQNSLSSIANPAASAAAASPITDLYDSIQGLFGVPMVANSINTANVTASWMMMNAIGNVALINHFIGNAPFGVTIGDVTPLGAGLGFGTTLAGSSSGLGGATLAGMGSAGSVGGMSVPTSWAANAPVTLAANESVLSGSGWTAAADASATGTGGAPGIMPGMASAGKGGMGLSGPRYGVKPKVMPKVLI